MIGEIIKDFKLTARLGKGGMGEVWAGEQQIVKTKVAIKLLLEEISSDKQHVDRFFNEAIAVSRIKHAGIVRIYDVGFHDQRAYLIMEYLDGESLAARIARTGRFPIGQLADIGRQIASILEATHAVRITHRDLKPDNIFVVPDAELATKERVKILDFGIAKLSTNATGATAAGMTATSSSLGTPAYMAPEQWNDAARADARADIYSLGCVAFEMCCGRPPFVAGSVGEACTKHLTVVPPRARSVVPELPAELDELIARMLEKSAADRPTIVEIGAVFGRLASTRPREIEPTLAPSHVSPPRALEPQPDTTLGSAAASPSRNVPPARRTGVFAAIGAVVVVGGAVGIYAATRHPTHDDAAAAGSDARATVTPPPPSHPTTTIEPPPPAALNAWVSIDPPATPITLGIDDDKAPEAHLGFRPARKVMSPPRAYALQEHEVTWGELDPWLASTRQTVELPEWAADPKTRAQLPATGMTWTVALAYCQSIGGRLPSEEQWEYAARGAERRPNPWGAELLDRELTHVYAGTAATPRAVKSSPQDVTPGADGHRLYDLAGNVQEWTMGLWREDQAGQDESSAQSGATTVRAIRGLPLAVVPPATMQPDSAAYRERLCATGPCVAKGRKLRAYIGFRCAK